MSNTTNKAPKYSPPGMRNVHANEKAENFKETLIHLWKYLKLIILNFS